MDPPGRADQPYFGPSRRATVVSLGRPGAGSADRRFPVETETKDTIPLWLAVAITVVVALPFGIWLGNYNLPIWASFIVWAEYFALGAKPEALKTMVPAFSLGVIGAALIMTAYALLINPLGDAKIYHEHGHRARHLLLRGLLPPDLCHEVLPGHPEGQPAVLQWHLDAAGGLTSPEPSSRPSRLTSTPTCCPRSPRSAALVAGLLGAALGWFNVTIMFPRKGRERQSQSRCLPQLESRADRRHPPAGPSTRQPIRGGRSPDRPCGSAGPFPAHPSPDQRDAGRRRRRRRRSPMNQQEMFSLDGRVALVAGGGGAIGSAMAWHSPAPAHGWPWWIRMPTGRSFRPGHPGGRLAGHRGHRGPHRRGGLRCSRGHGRGPLRELGHRPQSSVVGRARSSYAAEGVSARRVGLESLEINLRSTLLATQPASKANDRRRPRWPGW